MDPNVAIVADVLHEELVTMNQHVHQMPKMHNTRDSFRSTVDHLTTLGKVLVALKKSHPEIEGLKNDRAIFKETVEALTYYRDEGLIRRQTRGFMWTSGYRN